MPALSSMAQGSLLKPPMDGNVGAGHVTIRGANGASGVLCNYGTTCSITRRVEERAGRKPLRLFTDWRGCPLASRGAGAKGLACRQDWLPRPDVTALQKTRWTNYPIPSLSRLLSAVAIIRIVSSHIHHGFLEALIPAAAAVRTQCSCSRQGPSKFEVEQMSMTSAD
jgi:hypothetical protein